MKRAFLDSVRCPFCRRGGLHLTVEDEDEVEVRRGELTCAECGRRHPIREGIPDFVDPADGALAREVAGWIELAGPLSEALVPVMTALPHFPHLPWPHVAPDFFQIFEEHVFEGARVVDLGAGRTWSSRFLKTLGRAREVVAVDVLTTRFLGLATAEIYFAADSIHFERLRADIHRLPIVDGWADAVFSCAAVHHSGDLDALFAEVHRVLAPGGAFVLISEPVKAASITARAPINAETALGINEHIYSYSEYGAALRRAGFTFRRMSPRSLRYRLTYPDPDVFAGAPAVVRGLARSDRGRRLLAGLLRGRASSRLLYRYWSLPLSAIARKAR